MKTRRILFQLIRFSILGLCVTLLFSCKTKEIISNGGEPEIINMDVNRSYYFIDERDGKQYRAIKIGDQWWMAENLNTGIFVESVYNDDISHSDVSDNGIIEKYCLENNELNCDTYGGLYDWDEMMDYGPSDTAIVETTQGICPDGWHIPTDKEWSVLANSLGGEEFAGGKLKETDTIHWSSPNIGATNESGFTALPGEGRSNQGAIYTYGGQFTVFWTATIFTEPLSSNFPTNNRAYTRRLNHDLYMLIIRPYDSKCGFSVRCVRD
ncbi:MAG: fibrobacter succinogenes major paralogous domain-containing protein [Bacteroidales bacterium]|nr:MAG: fibrobacter succinogenes major paralogous domain-containing protein [Bacteroidales bacterium]